MHGEWNDSGCSGAGPRRLCGPNETLESSAGRFLAGSEEASHEAFLGRHLKEIRGDPRGQYGRPTHGNKERVSDEIVYIMLSRRTHERSYSRAYDRLKAVYPTWDLSIAAPGNTFVDEVRDAGLANRRAKAIRSNLAGLAGTFGSADRADFSRWSDRKLFSTLPASRKSARKAHSA